MNYIIINTKTLQCLCQSYLWTSGAMSIGTIQGLIRILVDILWDPRGLQATYRVPRRNAAYTLTAKWRSMTHVQTKYGGWQYDYGRTAT